MHTDCDHFIVWRGQQLSYNQYTESLATSSPTLYRSDSALPNPHHTEVREALGRHVYSMHARCAHAGGR